jgi:thiol-disulfide isomerase/thioredoxin
MLIAMSLSIVLSLPAFQDESEELEAVIQAVEKTAETDEDDPVAAIRVAAEAALKEHEAALTSGSGPFYRGLLLARAGKDEAAYQALVAFADAHPESELVGRARFEALMIGMGSREPEELDALAKKIDPIDLDEQQKRILPNIQRSITSDLERAALNGKPAPEFAVERVLNADSFDMSKLRGKVVLMDFWATWCPPCREVIPDLVELQKKHRDDVVVVGMTRLFGYGMDFSDPSAAKPHGGKRIGSQKEPIPAEREFAVNEAFIKAFEVNYPIVFTGPSVGKDYKVQGIPTVFVVDRQGNVVGNVVGAGEAAHAKLEKLLERALATKG